MIKIEKTEVYGWEAAIRGMRNPMNSWDRSDSAFNCSSCSCADCINAEIDECDGNHALYIGPNDHDLMMRLAKGGAVHAKYRRMITVTCDITAPLYWWKEFDTYKVGTVANSCSTMHKIHAKELTLDDFSHEKLGRIDRWLLWLKIKRMNRHRMLFIKTKKKSCLEKMIQLLSSSYNQKRTVQMNYEVLVGMYRWRKDHKLDEWREFCRWIKKLPYSEIITGEEE